MQKSLGDVRVCRHRPLCLTYLLEVLFPFISVMQLHSPTGVTHSSRAFLTHPPSAASDGQEGPLPNLIVVRSTVLEVYCALRLPGSEVRLELACRQKLYGVVESLAVLRGRTGRAGHDAVLLTFRDAKLSVLQWDPASHDLVPSSLHYFEGDESLRAGRQAFARPPLVVSDPRGRCAAVLMFRHQLAVLPATEAEAEAAALGVVTEGEALTAAAVGNSYIDNLGKAGIRDVRDAVFLHGTSEPTLLVLHEGDPTWAGTLRTKKDTCSLSALSINMTAKRHPRIWGAQGLPSDAYRAIATPTGGVLVLTNSMVLYYAQGVQAGVVLHSAALPTKAPLPPLAFDLTREAPGAAAARYAKAHANDLHPQAASDVLAFCDTSCAHWNLDCDAACAAWLSSTTALLGLKSGQLLLVELKRQGGAWKVVVGRAGAAPQPACMATLSSSIVFIGSVTGDSLLVQCTLGTQQQAGTSATGQNGADHGEEGREAKRRRLESADADAAQVGPRAPASGEESDEEALLIYGDDDSGATGARPEGSPPGLTCSLRVLDSFISIGPVRAIVSSGSVSGGALKASPYLLACCGAGKGGALAVLSRSVAPDVLTEVPLPGVMGAWAVGQAPNGSGNAFLLLTFPSSTKVLEAADQLREVTDEFEFAGDVPTLAAGAMCGGSQLLQAFPQGLRLLQDGQQVQEVWAAELAGPGAADSAAIAAVAIEDPYLLVHLADGSARVLRADASTGKIEVLGALPLDPGVRITAAALYKDSCGWLGRQLATSDVDSTADTLFAACAAFSDGTLALWCLPDLSGPPIWRAASLTEGHPILTPVASNAPLPMEASQAAAVVEVRLESFGSAWQSRPELPSPSAAPGCGPPVLCILTSDHTLLAYKAFSAAGRDPCGGATCLRFKRIHIDCPALLPPAANPSEGAPRIPRMVRFDGLGEQIPHNGLMVAGEVPLWLIACRGSLVAHPGAVGPGLAVSGFTPFNNINCPHGFITTCSELSTFYIFFCSLR